MNIDIFVEQWMGPESLDYYYIDWVVKEVKRLQLVEMSVQDFLDEKIDSLEFCRNMRDMGVIE